MDNDRGRLDYEQLKQDFFSLQDANEQLKRRLQVSERAKTELERRHKNELMKLTGELKQKIQRLEANHKTNELDVEELKEKLKAEFADVYDGRNFDLISELESQRQTYNEIRFQYSILKNEFESLQRTSKESEEKFRIQNETLIGEFENEKRLLLARVEQLSNSVDVDSLNVSNEHRKLSLLERKCAQLETDLKNSKDLQNVTDSRLKSEVRLNAIVVDELRKELRTVKALNSSLQQDFASAKSENIHLNAKLDVCERRQLENEKNLHLLRSSNDTLKEQLKNDVDEITSRMKIEIIQLKKQRDEKSAENEDLLEKVKTLNEDLLNERRRLDEMVLHTEEIKQTFKLTDVEQREAWSNEKRDLEAKLRDAELERRRLAMKYERIVHNFEMKLKQSEFEKDKIAEELADLKIQFAQSKKYEKISKSDESEKKLVASEEKTNTMVTKFTDEIQTLKNELAKRDKSLKRMETKFDSYQEKSVQFYDILKLCEAQMSKPVVVTDELQTDLMHDVRLELKKLNRKKDKNEKSSSKQRSEKGESE